jgi:hypothetical protein
MNSFAVSQVHQAMVREARKRKVDVASVFRPKKVKVKIRVERKQRQRAKLKSKI